MRWQVRRFQKGHRLVNEVLQVLVYGLTLAGLYLPIALGLNLIFGVMQILNFAHGEFYMLGALFTWAVLSTLDIPFVVAAATSILLVVALGALIERLFFRRLGEDMQRSLIVALGLGLVLQTAVVLSVGADVKHYSFPIEGMFSIGAVGVSVEKATTTLLALASATVFYLILQRTKLGRSIRAVAQDHQAAMLQGINIGKIRTVTIALGSSLAALGGALGGSTFGVEPFMGFDFLLYSFIIIIFGGLGSMEGTLLAGVLMALLQSAVTLYVGAIEATMVSFSVLYLMLLIRPTGLFGRERKSLM